MNIATAEVRKWVVLGALVLTALVAGSTYGEERTPCEQAYLESGLTQQQLSFEEFRELYADSLCAPGGDLARRSGYRVGEATSQTSRGGE
jgi:hypothetical protein